MKKRIFSVISVVMLIVMTLPAASPPVAAQPTGWPTIWTGLASDANEHCETFRNVADMDGDGYALYYDVDSQYIYLRMETVTAPGWPSTGSQGTARYKWWFNTAGTAAYVSGTSVYNAEFLLILEDRTDTSNVDGSRDQLGEVTLMDDLVNIGFAKRWNKGDSGAYLTGTPDNGGSSSLWKRAVGNGTAGTGGPQGVMGADIGYRIDNGFVDIYVSRAALGNPSSLCLIWATDNQNPNLDQAPNCDRPEEPNCIMLGKDFGDAPAPYPTLMANDGARHTVGDIYLGATIDAELDGQPDSTATGDDNSNLDDEDGVVFTTALVKGQSADVTVTASAAGYLDAWVDFNNNGDWADAGEPVFTSEPLSMGANNLNFTVPGSAQTGQTFARFRFSSTGGLSYSGLASDGEVEDHQVAIEGCTLTVNLTGDTSFCEGSGTTITAGVTDGTPPYSYDWTASTAPGSANNDSYDATGSGTVAVTVTDDNDCTGSDSVTVTANEGPTADFSADVWSCCDPLTVHFTDESIAGDNPIVSWYWEFGDGDTSTDQNPSHIYDDGTYTVTLTVTDEHGCTDIETKEQYITSNEGPTADFTSDVQSCCDPLTVYFTDLSTAGDNTIIDWYWEFGDGYTSTDQNPIHIYDDGTYTVSLTVTDSHGCSDTETKTEYITSNEGPTADFTSDVQSCCDPLTVYFTDLSTAGDNTIIDWYWEFGDGYTSTAQNPIHIYDDGTYTVSLTVTDSHGCSDTETKEQYITSNEGPTADFSADVWSCCDPLTVHFTDESIAGNNPIVSWYWEFGDGDTSTDQNPSHIYDDGTYTVTLTVTDEHGCTDIETKTEYITSNEGPTADFSANVTRCSLTVQFTDESTAGDNPIVSWSWDFGDGDTSIAQNSSHTYDTPGAYNVTLTVTDSHGCGDTDTETVTVYPKPTATASSNSPVRQGATIQLYGGPDDMVSYNWTGPGGWTSNDQNPTRPNAATAMAGTYTLTVTSEHGCTDDATTYVVVTVPRRPPPRGGGGGCPIIGCARYFEVDWDEEITRTCLPDNDRLAEDMLCPDPDGKHNLFLEQGTLAPEVDGERHYLIIIRELEEEDTPPVPDNTMAVAAFNITPAGAVFEEEIILTLGIDLLPDDAVGADIFYYDEADGQWKALPPVDPDGVAELTLSAGVNHFTVFAVLIELAPPAPPASFVASNLSIELSVEKIWSALTFVTKTGENVTITAKVENDGGQAGNYTVALKINGEVLDSETVTLDAGQSQYVSFTLSELDYGRYEVEVGGLSDTFTTFRTITWWLIIIIIAAIGLITWGTVRARRKRRARQQA